MLSRCSPDIYFDYERLGGWWLLPGNQALHGWFLGLRVSQVLVCSVSLIFSFRKVPSLLLSNSHHLELLSLAFLSSGEAFTSFDLEDFL